MSFRNPLTSLPADAITSGALTGAYTVPGLLSVGDPAGSRVELGVAGAGAGARSGLRLYAADGVTVLVDLNAAAGAGTVTAGTVRTAAPPAARVELTPSATNALRLWTGAANEAAPGELRVPGTAGVLELASPALVTGATRAALLRLTAGAGPAGAGAGSPPSVLELLTDVVRTAGGAPIAVDAAGSSTAAPLRLAAGTFTVTHTASAVATGAVDLTAYGFTAAPVVMVNGQAAGGTNFDLNLNGAVSATSLPWRSQALTGTPSTSYTGRFLALGR